MSDAYSLGFVSHFEDEFTFFLIPRATNFKDSYFNNKLLGIERAFWNYVDNEVPGDFVQGRRGGVNNLSVTLVGDSFKRAEILIGLVNVLSKVL